jgi:hypothetical protein
MSFRKINKRSLLSEVRGNRVGSKKGTSLSEFKGWVTKLQNIKFIIQIELIVLILLV